MKKNIINFVFKIKVLRKVFLILAILTFLVWPMTVLAYLDLGMKVEVQKGSQNNTYQTIISFADSPDIARVEIKRNDQTTSLNRSVSKCSNDSTRLCTTDNNLAEGAYTYQVTVYKDGGTAGETVLGQSSVQVPVSAEALGVSVSGTGLTGPSTNTGNTSGGLSAVQIGTIIFPKSKVTSLSDLIVKIINWLLDIAGGLAGVAIVYSGLMYITAGGDAEKAMTAKKNLIWAIIGVVIILLAIIIVNTLNSVLHGSTTL